MITETGHSGGEILAGYLEQALLRKPIYATDFSRFTFRPRNDEKIIFPYEVSSSGYNIIPEEVFSSRFPLAYDYLRKNRKKLESRKQWRDWYGFSAPRNLHIHESADFVVPLLADRGLAAPLPNPSNEYCLMASGGFSVRVSANSFRPEYVLGLVNSRLLFWNLKLISNRFRGGWITCTKQYFGTLPIYTAERESPSFKSCYETLCKQVKQICRLRSEAEAEKTTHQKTLLQRQIAATDREIDRLVYELYGLTDEEIAIVEQATSR